MRPVDLGSGQREKLVSADTIQQDRLLWVKALAKVATSSG